MHARISFALFALLLIAAALSAQESGAVRYLGHFIPPQGGSYTAGCWGWTDTTTGREYALLGNYSGTSIVEITNPNAMVERDFVPGVSSTWRELQVHENYLYVVSEGGGGTQIIDLSYLPDSVHLVKNYTFTQSGKTTSQSHSIHIKDGFMYLNGCAGWSPGGIVIFDLADPINPVYKSAYTRNYVHDCYVRNDTIFAAAIYGIGADIIDISNKLSPVYLSTVSYPGSGTHNTATTIDGRYLFTTDEIGATAKTLKIWDITSPPAFTKVAEYVGSATAIVHNAFVKDSMVIMSYYTAGIRVVNIADPSNPIEIGGYDSYPANDDGQYDGAWSVYPYFPSGKIIIGDMASGLYVVDINLNGPMSPSPFSAYSDYQTPTSVTLTWDDPTQFVSGAPLSNFELHVYRNNTLIAAVDSGIEAYTDGGRVNHQLYTYTIRAVTATDSSSIATSQVYAGGAAQPNPPLLFEALDAVGGTELRWKNPSTQIDGTPMNDFAAVLIYRDGILRDSLLQSAADTGQLRSYTDSVIGYHTFSLRIHDNETPVYFSAYTATLPSMGGAYTSYDESFDTVLTAFQKTGGWDTTQTVASNGSHAITDSPFGSYDPSTVSTVVLPTVILGDHYLLSFKHIAIVAFADFAFVEVSKNHRTTYSVLKVYNQTLHSQWQDGVANPGDWVSEVFDLSAYSGDTVNVRFRMVTNGSVNADGWYVDNIVIGPADGVTASNYPVNANWNMVSLPVDVSDGSAAAVYPGAVSPAFAFNGGYAPEDTLVMGTGYWLKFPSASSVPITGAEVRRDTIDLAAGWNIVGSVSAGVDSAALKTIPSGILASPLYGYNGGYAIAASVAPGHGYWVKASVSGKLVLNSFVNKVQAAAPRDPMEGMSTIVFSDAEGRAQTLAVGTEAAGAARSTFELPPLPPSGAFDVRFASQRSAELFPGAEALTVVLQSVRYPLTIGWNIAGGADLSLRSGDRDVPLRGSGSISIGEPVPRLEIRPAASAAAPKSYALSQNYPNPFNPRTEVRFELPEAGFVTLAIFDLLGREVGTLVREIRDAGMHSETWDASDSPSGIYYARLSVTSAAGEQRFRSIRKLVLAK